MKKWWLPLTLLAIVTAGWFLIVPQDTESPPPPRDPVPVVRVPVAPAPVDVTPAPPIEPDAVRRTSGHSWVRVQFRVWENGDVGDILLVESCVRDTEAQPCTDDDLHDDYAISLIRARRYELPGVTEEVIRIPASYPLPKQ